MAVATMLCLGFAAGGKGQSTTGGPPPAYSGLPSVLDGLHQGAALHVSVLTENKARLDRQAVVRLHCDYPQGTVYQTTGGDSETTFLGLLVAKYDLEISAVGYLSAHKEVQVTGFTDNLQSEVVLQRDPTAVNFDASGTADALMPAKASKETRHAVKALKSGSFQEAQKHLESAYKLVPSSSRVNFLLGYGFFQQQKFEQAEASLARSIALDPHNGQALALLGRLDLLRGLSDQAAVTLERAVDANPDDWLSHSFLGDAYLKQKEYQKAQEHAQLALDKGKGDASSSELILGQAEANLGHIPEAITALKAFLLATPASPLAAQVRTFISDLEQRASSATAAGAPAPLLIPSSSGALDPLLEASKPELSVAWQPPGIDEAKPTVAADVACPYQKVLEGVGEHVQELAENVGRFAAIEDLLHERLDNLGNAASRETRKFDYAANISQPKPGFIDIDEYRTERYGPIDLPDGIATAGLYGLALIFHPSVRDNYEINCEGLGEWRGQATWLMHFRQREDRPSRIGTFKAGDNAYPINLKGRVWITADTLQIMRIESELSSPIRQIQFLAQHSIAEYGPVHFQKKNLDIWLPKSAEIYLDLRRHRYYRRHSFDHYMLFSVDSEEKVREAKHDPHGPGSITPRKRKQWPA